MLQGHAAAGWQRVLPSGKPKANWLGFAATRRGITDLASLLGCARRAATRLPRRVSWRGRCAWAELVPNLRAFPQYRQQQLHPLHDSEQQEPIGRWPTRLDHKHSQASGWTDHVPRRLRVSVTQ